MIVDFHSHDFPDALAPRAIAGLCRRTGGALWPSADGSRTAHLAHLRLAGVDRAVLCMIATKPSQFDVLLSTAEGLRDGAFGEEAARRIVPFLSVHPADPQRIARVEAVARAGFKGLKFHPYYQDFRLDDPEVVSLFRRIAELGLVVECHCGFDVGFPDRHDACGPAEAATLLERVPGLKFVAAHLGGCAGYAPHATDRLLELGAYIDTSALRRDFFMDEQMRLLHSWPVERLLFATDYPWNDLGESLRWVRQVRDRRDHDAVLGGNAARLLGLD